MIEVINLTKRYGNKDVVDHINFRVEKGEIVGFLGPNGAGKSTTMNMITGYLSATDGSVKVDGYDVLENPNAVKERIGYLPELPPLYLDMTVKEYLKFVCELKKVKENHQTHINRIAQMVKIGDVLGRRIQNLSKGYKQRVGLAQALVGDPEVLILDEPTVGLDPQQIIEIRNVIKTLGKNRTVILSSHILPEVSAICERILIINKGKIVLEGNPEELGQHLGNVARLQVRIAGDEATIDAVIHRVSGVSKIRSLGQKEAGSFDYMLESSSDADIRSELFRLLVDNHLELLMSKRLDMSLEDIFMQAIDKNSPLETYEAAKKQEKEAKSETQAETEPTADDLAASAEDEPEQKEEDTTC